MIEYANILKYIAEGLLITGAAFVCTEMMKALIIYLNRERENGE